MVQGRQGFRVVARSTAPHRRRLALWIAVAATATNAALLGLVGLVIQLPGQSATTVTWLILVFLVLSALTVVFEVAGLLVERRAHAADQERQRIEDQAARERKRRDQVDRLLSEGSSARLPRLSELSDESLGATPTFYTREGQAPYVRRRAPQRDHDTDVRALLSEPGPPYPFVVVWGTTKAGKSRTVAEAARAVFDDDPVVILPRGGGQALAELVWLGLPLLPEGGPALVWLDDLNPADLEALVSSVLEAVTERAVIVATMTARRREEVVKTGGEVTAVARAALNRAREFELPFKISGVEKIEAQQLYPEEEFDGSIAETLVGGSELVAKYRASQDSHPAGCALVRAAVDCRRAGLSRPVTESELRHLFPMYVQMVSIGVSPTTEQFTEGMKWATEPIASQVALLHVVNHDSQSPRWTVFDHAVTADDGTSEHQPRDIPTELWRELIAILPGKDLFGIGIAAYSRRRTNNAITAFRKASTTDNPQTGPMSKLMVGLLLTGQGDSDAARIALQQAIDSGHQYAAPEAALTLGLLMAEQGNTDAARTAVQQAIDSGHQYAAPEVAVDLGIRLAEQGDTDAARTVYQNVIDSGHPDQAPKAGLALGILLAKHGDTDAAQAALRQAIDSGHPDHAPQAAIGLGLLLVKQGDTDAARIALQQAIDSGHPQVSQKAQTLLADLDDLSLSRR